jgi:hypothetical protein
MRLPLEDGLIGRGVGNNLADHTAVCDYKAYSPSALL